VINKRLIDVELCLLMFPSSFLPVHELIKSMLMNTLCLKGHCKSRGIDALNRFLIMKLLNAKHSEINISIQYIAI
jgi:hypothetical protein